MFFIFGWQSQFAPSLLALYWIHRKLIVVLIDIMTNEIATKKYDGTSLWSNAKKIASIRLVAFLPSHHFTLMNSEHIFCTFLCRFCAIRYSISIKWFFLEFISYLNGLFAQFNRSKINYQSIAYWMIRIENVFLLRL